MRFNLNEAIVAEIRNHLPFEGNIVTFLTDLLCLGKESIYRRIRGDIPFTLEEVVTISTRLGLSIDNMVGLGGNKQIYFDLNSNTKSNKVNLYTDRLRYLLQFQQGNRRPQWTKHMALMNYLPYTFTIACGQLTKFRCYKWMHHNRMVDIGHRLSDFKSPQDVLEIGREWRIFDRTNVDATYIMDNNMFVSMIKDINYFYKRNLLTDGEVNSLKTELLSIIERIEKVSRTGLDDINGARINLYLSSLSIAATYLHFEFEKHVTSHVLIYDVDVLASYNQHACKVQKEWIDLFKRYSTLITQSGEKERFDFLRQQREYIMKIGVSDTNMN